MIPRIAHASTLVRDLHENGFSTSRRHPHLAMFGLVVSACLRVHIYTVGLVCLASPVYVCPLPPPPPPPPPPPLHPGPVWSTPAVYSHLLPPGPITAGIAVAMLCDHTASLPGCGGHLAVGPSMHLPFPQSRGGAGTAGQSDVVDEDGQASPVIGWNDLHVLYQLPDGSKWAEHGSFYDCEDLVSCCPCLLCHLQHSLPSLCLSRTGNGSSSTYPGMP